MCVVAGRPGDVTSTRFGFREHHRNDAPDAWGDGPSGVGEGVVDELFPPAERLARVGDVELEGERENTPLSKQSRWYECARRLPCSETLERRGEPVKPFGRPGISVELGSQPNKSHDRGYQFDASLDTAPTSPW
jgi:hypothetical protein